MSKPFKHDPQWAKAKKICRLNQDDIQMAKELGRKPKSLLKNNPSPSQGWKLPVKLWIRQLHERRFGRRVHALHNQSGPARIDDAPTRTTSVADVTQITREELDSAGASAESFDVDIPF